MENIYSVFYTGKPNPFGIGTWDSVPTKLKHSSSQPYISNKSNPLPPILSDQVNNGKNNFNNTQFLSKNNENLKLPIIDSRPASNYRPKKVKRIRTKSSEESSYNYDENKTRKELSNFVKDINKGIAIRLQNDNFIAQQKLNNIKNNYNEIRTLLNNKIDKLEQDQQMQFENLKFALEQSGGLKMMGAVKNANGGNNYDLRRAEEEDIIDATRKLPRLLEDKINVINDMKRKEKEDEKRLISKVRQKVNEEIQKQKEKDEIRYKKEIEEIEQKRENIRQERVKLMEELQNQENEESESDSLSNPNHPPTYGQNMPSQGLPPAAILPPQVPPIIQPYPPFLQNMYPPMTNNNNSKDSIGELLKIFLFKKIFDDKPEVQNAPQVQPQFIPTPYPQPQYPPPPQYQPPPPQPQQPITIPQPIIYQSPPPVVSPPNIIIQKESPQPQPQIQPQIVQPPVQYKDIVITKSETIKSEKGIPFVDPLEQYLKETRPARKVKSKKKTTKKSIKKSTRKKTTVKEKTEEEEEEEEEEEDDSTPPPIQLKLYDPDNMDNNKVINISKSNIKVSKNTKDSKAAKKSSKKNTKKSTAKKESQPKESKEKKKTSSSKKPSKPKEPEEEKKEEKKPEEEEEEYDEDEEEEEDDEEEEEEEEDGEGGKPEEENNQRIIRRNN